MRYEYGEAGGLLHLDTKKLARIDGLVTGLPAIDEGRSADAAMTSFTSVPTIIPESLTSKSCRTSAAKLPLLSFDAPSPGTSSAASKSSVSSPTTAPCYRAHVFAAACRDPAIRHLRTKPYTPRTNGKAERLIQTLLREWAYRHPFHSSAERKQLLEPYLHFYNHHRMHLALDDQPPISRLNLNNVLRRDI